MLIFSASPQVTAACRRNCGAVLCVASRYGIHACVVIVSPTAAVACSSMFDVVIYYYACVYVHCVPKKEATWCLIITGKCRPIFPILSPIDSSENSLCTYYKDFHLTCNILLHYLVKFENSNVTEFSRWTWQLICLSKFTVRSYATCHKNIALLILLKYVYNTWSIA